MRSFTSVGRRFISDVNGLIEQLNQTKAHFVRCIKPNKQLARSSSRLHSYSSSFDAQVL